MVLGLRGKSRRGSSVQAEYLIHVQEIKPWPVSQHLKSVKSVMLQWENDGQSLGFFTSDIGDENILFGDCFRLPVTLCRETSKKKASTDSFQKNFLEFFVYEARKEKTAKGQLLGSAVINLADFGVIQETMAIKTPLNFKKSSKNMTQSLLYITFQPSDAPKDSSLLDKDDGASVSWSMAGEDEEEVEFASFTDDDDNDGVSSHSSQIMSSSAYQSQRNSPAQTDKVGAESLKDITAGISGKPATLTGKALKQSEVIPLVQPIRPSNGTNTDPRVGLNRNFATSSNNQTIYRTDNKALKIGEYKAANSEQVVDGMEDEEHAHQPDIGYEEQVLDISKHTFKEKASEKQVASRSNTIQVNRKAHGGPSRAIANNKLKHVMSNQFPSDSVKRTDPLGNISISEKQNDYPVDGSSAQKSYATNGSKEKHNVLSSRKVEQKPKGEMRREANALAIRDKAPDYSATGGSKQAHHITSKYNANLESEVELLIEELREAAALEAGLYSAVAEHGSSTNKVHAPARRLSRFYVHAYKAKSPLRRASAARAAVSGLVLVSKACGNDVARLTFWLSNAIVLRAIVSQDASKYQLFAGHYTNNNKAATVATDGLSSRRQESFLQNVCQDDLVEPSFDWEDPRSFIVALKKVEAWIFYRIVESVWWQSMTPHMQSAAAKSSSSRKAHGKKYGLGDQDQGSFSIDIWKRAFKDACERLCPLRAGGHECGCLPVLGKLVMEQLVNRLDVAMFNAILRESADEMPTDPVSDPISDTKVLPIPVGKSSFGSGAQLKNAIGNWSRWLTDLFGIDDTDAADDNNEPHNHGDLKLESSFKPFNLLNALSGLMMLPFEMLADKATRKEVCPLFDAPMIKRVLNNFSPDEFCPNPVPEELLAALDSEEAEDTRGDCTTDFPCDASPTVYSPPSTVSVLASIGDGGSQTHPKSVSSVLKKLNTSDDELDELESPLASITLDSSRLSPTSSVPNWMLKGKGARNVVRYQLLREAWRENI